MKVAGQVHVVYSRNDKFNKMYLTFMSLDGVFLSRAAEETFTQHNIEYGVSENFSFDFKFNLPEGF